MDYEPNEVIIDRAVELWKRMLRHPKYDNGDAGPVGGMAMVMAHLIPSNVTEDRLEAFGAALKAALMERNQHGSYGYMSGLHTDYGPDKTLADAAQAAGLEVEFPWKTNMWIHRDDLTVSCGYGAAHVYHYPLADGRWLITALSGEDMPKILAAVEAGTLTSLVIEPAGCAAR